MLAVSKQKRRNPIHLFHDKALPMGSMSERLVDPVLDCFDNSKGSAAYKLFSIMSKESQFVTGEKSAPVTPAQQNLLSLLHGPNGVEIAQAIRQTLDVSIFHSDPDFFNRDAALLTASVLEAISAINAEWIQSHIIFKYPHLK